MEWHVWQSCCKYITFFLSAASIIFYIQLLNINYGKANQYLHLLAVSNHINRHNHILVSINDIHRLDGLSRYRASIDYWLTLYIFDINKRQTNQYLRLLTTSKHINRHNHISILLDGMHEFDSLGRYRTSIEYCLGLYILEHKML